MATESAQRRATAFVPVELWNWRTIRLELVAVHKAAGIPWSDTLALMDLRYAEWCWALGRKDKLPGRRCLMADWNMPERNVRLLLKSGRWRDDALRVALANRKAVLNREVA
jgi:hypothetical protein